MSRTKAMICAALFLALTLIKFSNPQAAGEMREKVVPVLSGNADYKKSVTALGEKITSNQGIISVLGRYYPEILESGNEDEKEPESRPEPDFWKQEEEIKELKKAQLQSVIPWGLCGMLPSADLREYQEEPEPEAAEEPEPEADIPAETPPEEVRDAEENSEEELPEAVAAFLETQQVFSDYAVPANVSYLMPRLPLDYCVPVAGYNSSGFGYRDHPILEGVRFHYGTDYAAYTGTEVMAFAGGTVIEAGESDSFGQYIIISHDYSYTTLYAHCSALYVGFGDTVEKGQVIALVGESGMVTGPHLHFELKWDTIYLNPEYYV